MKKIVMEKIESKTDVIYENTDDVKEHIPMETEDLNTTGFQPPDNTESDSLRLRSFGAALVCLVLLCFLLLTAVMVLSVFIYTNNTNYTEEKCQLLTSIINLTKEKYQLLTNFTEERNQLLTNITNLTEEKEQLINKLLRCQDGWVYYLSSLYYLSNETKSWSESRQYCRDRGADLIIINSIEEQNAVESMIIEQSTFWIGLIYRNDVGRWKWVDDSELYSFRHFWYGEPWRDCAAVAVHSGLNSYSCDYDLKWICEKRISTHILL